MKDYYVAKVNVIIDGAEGIIVPISGQNYDPNVVKGSAISRAKETHEGTKFAAVILTVDHYDLEEYKQIIGGTPPWLRY